MADVSGSVWPLLGVASIGMMAITEPQSPTASGDARRHVGAAGLPPEAGAPRGAAPYPFESVQRR
jgi:hypothetical protein